MKLGTGRELIRKIGSKNLPFNWVCSFFWILPQGSGAQSSQGPAVSPRASVLSSSSSSQVSAASGFCQRLEHNTETFFGVCLQIVYVKFSLLQTFTNMLPVTNHHRYSFLWSELLFVFQSTWRGSPSCAHAYSLIHAAHQGIHPGAFLNIQFTDSPCTQCLLQRCSSPPSPSLVMFSHILSLWLFEA